MKILKEETLNFFKEIKHHNNKPWFEENKPRYEAIRNDFADFVAELVSGIKKFEFIPDKDPKKYLFRIYRDLRFSPDKTPYKTHLSAVIDRGLNETKCPFYIHIQPGESFVGGGIWQPSSDLLRRVRQEIDFNGSDLNKIIQSKSFKNTFGFFEGEKLSRPPKGYEVNNPNIELLKLKQYVIRHSFSDKEVCSEEFGTKVLETYQAALDFFHFFDVVKEEQN
jgi:uncharacterized protein (TIGR02453 family)